MKVFICIDKDGGMMFNHRRQSRDRTVVEDVIRHISDRRLYICPYSKELFPRYGNIIVSDAPLAAAGGAFVLSDSPPEPKELVYKIIRQGDV